MADKKAHEHKFQARRLNATVETCACGKFRYTAYGLKVLPIVTEQRMAAWAAGKRETIDEQESMIWGDGNISSS